MKVGGFFETYLPIKNTNKFTSYLSMIDILMNCSKEQIVRMLKLYKLD
ncbi:WbqC family protein [Psychrobacter frigidicola]